MTRRIGRPMKYSPLLAALDNEKIYCPASIVHHAQATGLLDELWPGKNDKQARLKARHSLARFTVGHHFPKTGDGLISEPIPGQPPLRGWFGWRWKEACSDF